MVVLDFCSMSMPLRETHVHVIAAIIARNMTSDMHHLRGEMAPPRNFLDCNIVSK